jgi:hypothetical protein
MDVATGMDTVTRAILIGSVMFNFGLVGKITFDWLATGRKKNGNGVSKNLPCTEALSKIDAMVHDVKWLHDAHDKTDEDGTPLWYIPRSLLVMTRTTAEKAVETNMHLREIRDVLKENGRILVDIMKNGDGG